MIGPGVMYDNSEQHTRGQGDVDMGTMCDARRSWKRQGDSPEKIHVM